MKKLSLRTIAFLQAAGVATYVFLFAFTVQTLGRHFDSLQVSPILSMAAVLMAFVFSATVCSSVFLGYPAYLFFEGRRKESLRLVLMSIVWLAGFLVAFLILLPFSAGL